MIGIFDSGIGGLGIYQELKKRLPNIPVLYLADDAFAPYGDKSEQEIRDRAVWIVHELEHRGAEMVIAACNTATVLALSEMRAATCIPVVGTVPAIKPANEMTDNGNIVVLGTTRTVQSAYQQKLIRDYATNCNVTSLPCPGLVHCIEHQDTTSPTFQNILQSISQTVTQTQADTVVLGCTHYTVIRSEIQKAVGEKIHLVDSNEAVAKQAERVAHHHHLIAKTGEDRFLSTDPKAALQKRVAWALHHLMR